MINRGEEMENNSKKIDEVNLNQNVDLEEDNAKEAEDICTFVMFCNIGNGLLSEPALPLKSFRPTLR